MTDQEALARGVALLPWCRNAVAHEGIYPVKMESDEFRIIIAALEAAERIEQALAEAREALKPFAEMALRFGMVYLDEQKKKLGDNPYNQPHNYSTAVMRAAENTSWADWRRALEAY